jgi:hypothetical protein
LNSFFLNLGIKIRFEVCDYDIKSITNKQEDNVIKAGDETTTKLNKFI